MAFPRWLAQLGGGFQVQGAGWTGVLPDVQVVREEEVHGVDVLGGNRALAIRRTDQMADPVEGKAGQGHRDQPTKFPQDLLTKQHGLEQEIRVSRKAPWEDGK